MVKEIYKSKYVKVEFDEVTKIYSSTYLPETENMMDVEWQKLMEKLKDLIEECKPQFIIDNNSERRYGYSPDMQKWTLDLFTDSWNSIGLRKYAQIRPSGIVGQLTTQQIEELAATEFNMIYEIKVFDDYISAFNWVNE